MRLGTSAIDRLGDRLRQSEVIAPTDLEMLQQLRYDFDAAMAAVQSRLTDLVPDSRPTSRLKTVQTLVGKLRQLETMNLSQVQDVAGVRIVRDMTLVEQDGLVGRIVAAFDGTKTFDRRAKPSFGYRAVHVVAKVDGRLVEIQVRTQLQDRWAQILERLADHWGRHIRYGEAPIEPWTRVGPMDRAVVVDLARRLSPLIASCEESEARVGGRLNVPNDTFRRTVTASLAGLAKLDVSSKGDH